MTNSMVEFVMFRLVPVVAVLMLVVGGMMLLFAGAKPEMLGRAKGVITATVIGVVLILAAWIIVNTIFENSGVIKKEIDGKAWQWYNIGCQVR